MHLSADVHVFNVGEIHLFGEVKPWQLVVVVLTLLAWNQVERLANELVSYVVNCVSVLNGLAALLAAFFEWLWRIRYSAEQFDPLDHQRA